MLPHLSIRGSSSAVALLERVITNGELKTDEVEGV